MTNIIVLCHDRYRLTVQTIQSIRRNTDPAAYTLTLVDDDSQDFRVRNFLDDQVLYNPKNTTLVRVLGSRHCLGALKNLGVMHSELTFGRGEWLCVLDNDVFVFPGWLDKMVEACFGHLEEEILIGGVRHPFHQPNGKRGMIDVTDAVAGYCHFMDWATWGYVGPYDANAPGIGQSEDYAICRKVYEHGFCGYVNPPVMAHCGITNSNGELIASADQIERLEGILYA